MHFLQSGGGELGLDIIGRAAAALTLYLPLE